VGDGASILELGCGAGRLTHPLAELGHRVVAVDESQSMLTNVRDTETVLADIFILHLGRSFDAVVLASDLISNSDPDRRHQSLSVCKAHARHNGAVLLERLPTGTPSTDCS
jgi:2-polyprenyl-3-methyl-5-hydroxy-6-metoxy-1,4-benzoquinol methylase